LSGGFARSVAIVDVYRDPSTLAIVDSTTPGSINDPSTKRVTLTVSWVTPKSTSIDSSFYVTRYVSNASFTETSVNDFTAGINSGTQVSNTSGGEVKLASNNYAKWCSPALSSSTIDLPDGPPVAVAAMANPTNTSIPNDVFVAVAPTTSTPVKLAYLTVTANTDPPVPTLRGTFTLDTGKYSNSSYVPTGINLSNNFKTNDVKYYKSSSNKIYALLATDLPDHEVIAILIKDGSGNDAYQDPANKIYKYQTFFNTRIYQGASSQDQAPFGYGGVSLAVLGNSGYVVSGGYLYTFDLSNIDSKTANSGLDMVGCRIELNGYDCNPGSGIDRKYGSGQTGTSWSDTTTPAHNDCSDGGNIELYADNDIYPVQVGSNTYVFVAVGAGTDPELNIVNVTSVPTGSSSPKINNNSCGRISNGNSGWKRIGSLDFNTKSGTEEAANSVYVNTAGTRAYISSNGGIDSNHDGSPDSYQLYVINTESKSSPRFLSGTSSPPSSGYYYGSGANAQLYPRRSLTVLNGLRAILVGKDSVTDGNDAQEYQVLNIENESTPTYCGGVNFDQGFNDLTSVSEADGDNFVYMVANTMEKQLKIIQGGPDNGIYVPSGTFTSQVHQFSYSTAFNNFNVNINQPAQTTIKAQVAVASPVAGSCAGATFNYVGPNANPGLYFTSVGNTISGVIPFESAGSYQNPNRCFKYKLYLDTTDFNQTPTLNNVTVNYSP